MSWYGQLLEGRLEYRFSNKANLRLKVQVFNSDTQDFELVFTCLRDQQDESEKRSPLFSNTIFFKPIQD